MNLSYVCLCVQYLGAWGFKWDSCWAQLHGACSTSLVAKACPSLSIASISINDDIILYSFLYIYMHIYNYIYRERDTRNTYIYIHTYVCVTCVSAHDIIRTYKYALNWCRTSETPHPWPPGTLSPTRCQPVPRGFLANLCLWSQWMPSTGSFNGNQNN